ncbi:hypothetical protein SNEBB_009201 [Seison nebaliae]|nr:hypothetical protein SNEBB_009201 [Seison nebaliae]
MENLEAENYEHRQFQKKKTEILRNMTAADLDDLENPDIPIAYFWTVEDVGRFMADLDLAQYIPAFKLNSIDGKKLINISASTLPHMGIQDFFHMKRITAAIRSAMRISNPNTFKSVADEKLSLYEQYLYYKSKTGIERDRTPYSNFL